MKFQLISILSCLILQAPEAAASSLKGVAKKDAPKIRQLKSLNKPDYRECDIGKIEQRYYFEIIFFFKLLFLFPNFLQRKESQRSK